MQVALLKAITFHEELSSILSGCTKYDNHAEREAWAGGRAIVLKRNPNAGKEEGEDFGEDNTVLKKMENIYKQAKVSQQ